MSDLLDSTDAASAQESTTHRVRSAPTMEVNLADDASKVGQRLCALLAWLPSLLVVTALVAIGWYGHLNEWKLPSAGLADSGADGPPWCDSHGVPEDECIVCQPDLIEDPPQLSFCHQHGVHGCVLCNPSIAETKQPTQPTPSDLERADRALALRPRLENLAIASSPGSRIQFASIDSDEEGRCRCRTGRTPTKLSRSFAAAAEIRYDATKTAQVSPPADGIVRRILADLGSWVQPGQVLAIIDSTDGGPTENRTVRRTG